MKPNHIANQSLQFQVLSKNQCEDIHSAVLTTLQEVGVEVKSGEAINLLKRGGAFVEGSRAWIPRAMVERALRNVPRGFTLYSRGGDRRLLFEGKNFYFGPGPSTTYTIDPYSGERRLPRKQDARNAARVVDALENIDFAMDFGTIQDVPTKYADLHQLQAILENTSKPIVHWGFNAQNCRTITEICCQISGNMEELQKRPFLAFFASPNTPLFHTVEALEKLMFVAKTNLPFVYVTAPTAGSTSPVTLAGTLVVNLSECLSGLVIHQLVREGAPFALGGVPGASDMKTLTMSYGCPEFNLMHAALTEMAHYYDLPLWGSAGCTDSKKVDEQAAVEATASIMLSAMSGTNMIHDVGYMEGGNCSNLAMMVMCDEIIGYTKRLIKGVRVDDNTLALEAIKRVGPMGEYVTDEHTYANFKQEFWFPGLMDRSHYQKWMAGGGVTLGEKAASKVKDLIENHRPEPLPPKTGRAIEQIIANASLK